MPSARVCRSREVQSLSRIDPWFLAQIDDLVLEEQAVQEQGLDSVRSRSRARAQAQRFFRSSPGDVARHRRRPACAVVAMTHGHSSGLQARRYLRRRIRDLHGLHVFDLRRGMRSQSHRSQEDHDPRRRAESHRAGHRVRLLLRACGAGAARSGFRDHHGQLQSGNRFHRLRHLRSAVLRAADVRRRDGDHRQGKAGRRDRAVRRPDAAEAVPRARSCGRADHRHDAGCHRRRRRPRTLPATRAAAESQAAAELHGPHRRAGHRDVARRSASRWSCGLRMCLAAAPWKSSSTKTTCART